MNRRRFIAGTAAWAGTLALPRLIAQTPNSKRGAVVIGIDDTWSLPPLHAARSGAREFASWLEAEGFDVTPLIDESGPVKAGAVFDAVREMVDRDLELLVIYFAGHGFVNMSTEFWLLSDALRNANEAVGVVENREVAHRCAVPNIVFISDTCRSTVESLQAQSVRGSIIFPTLRVARPKSAVVDQFFATSWSLPAFEVTESANAYCGLYTETFLDAFRKAEPALIEHAPDGTLVVTDAKLQQYLALEVPRRALAQPIPRDQQPEARIDASSAQIYLGHATPRPRGEEMAEAPTNEIKRETAKKQLVAMEAYERIQRAASEQVVGFVPPPPPKVVLPGAAGAALIRATGVRAAALQAHFKEETAQRDAVATTTEARDRLEIAALVVGSGRAFVRSDDTGLSSGLAAITECFAPAGVKTALDSVLPSASTVTVTLPDGVNVAPVGLVFANGQCAVLPVIRHYRGEIATDNVGISAVSFTPSRGSPLRARYLEIKNAVDTLHADAATAARLSVFVLDGGRSDRARQAEKMARELRVTGGIDPTLALYAAYAYAEANLPVPLRALRRLLRASLGAELFDVALLAALSPDEGNAAAWVPFFPALTAGWNYLRARGVAPRHPLEPLREHLRSSLWTTFAPAAVAPLKPLVQQTILRA